MHQETQPKTTASKGYTTVHFTICSLDSCFLAASNLPIEGSWGCDIRNDWSGVQYRRTASTLDVEEDEDRDDWVASKKRKKNTDSSWPDQAAASSIVTPHYRYRIYVVYTVDTWMRQPIESLWMYVQSSVQLAWLCNLWTFCALD